MEIIHIRDSDSEDSIGEPLEISNSSLKSNNNTENTQAMEIIHIRDSDSEDSIGEPLEISNSSLKSNNNTEKFVTNYGAGYCRKQIYKLPESFFHLPNNVYLLNRCQPFYISLVDCKKHPRYYWKKSTHLGLNHKATCCNTDTLPITKDVEIINGLDHFKTKYDVIIKTCKNNCNESILVDDISKKPLIDQNVADRTKDTKIRHNIIENLARKPCTKHLHFRKNKGLVGLKIQTSEYKPAEIEPLSCSKEGEVIKYVSQYIIRPVIKSNDLNFDKILSVDKQNFKSDAEQKQVKRKDKQEIYCEKKIDEQKTEKTQHNTKANIKDKCNNTWKSTQLKKHSGVSSKAKEKWSKPKEFTEKLMANIPFKPVEPMNSKLTAIFDLVHQNTQNNGDNLLTDIITGDKAMNSQASLKEQILISEVNEHVSPCVVQHHQKVHISNDIDSTFVKKQSIDYKTKKNMDILPKNRSKISILTKKKNGDSSTKMVPPFVCGSQIKEMKFVQPSGFNTTGFDNVSAGQLWQQSCHTSGGIPYSYIYQDPEVQYAQGIKMPNIYCNQGNPTSYPHFPMQPNSSFSGCSSSNNVTCRPQNHVDLQVLPQKPETSVLFDSNLVSSKPTSNSDSVIGFNDNGIVRKINISEPKLLRQNDSLLIRNYSKDSNSYKQKHRIFVKKITNPNSNAEYSRRILAPGLTSIKPQKIEWHQKVYPELSKALSSAPKSCSHSQMQALMNSMKRN